MSLETLIGGDFFGDNEIALTLLVKMPQLNLLADFEICQWVNVLTESGHAHWIVYVFTTLEYIVSTQYTHQNGAHSLGADIPQEKNPNFDLKTNILAKTIHIKTENPNLDKLWA